MDATAKTPDLSFGGSRKSEFRNFSSVTAEGSRLKFRKFVFFVIPPKSIVATFGSGISMGNGIVITKKNSLRSFEILQFLNYITAIVIGLSGLAYGAFSFQWSVIFKKNG